MMLKKYNIQEMKSEKLGHGATSQAEIIHTGDKKYILRRLKSISQASLEYDISELLKDEMVVPEIILTADGKKYIEENGVVYNLQEYIDGSPIYRIDEAIIKEIGKQVAILHKALSLYIFETDVKDRFALLGAMEQNEEKKNLLINCLEKNQWDAQHFERKCREWVALDDRKEQLIHGDLGFWNMLRLDNSIYLIDFGECRWGSIYFDVAAVVASVLSKNYTTDVYETIILSFMKSYSIYHCVLEPERLYNYLMLWYARGIYAVLLDESSEEEKEKRISFFLKEMKKGEHVFQKIRNK